MNIWAIIAAGGQGTRFGGDIPKQFVKLNGREVMLRSVDALIAAGIENIVLVVPSDMLSFTLKRVSSEKLPAIRSIVPGGETRVRSIVAGLDAVPRSAELVAIHDAARPLVQAERIQAVIEAAEENGAAILASKASDTVKLGGKKIQRTVPRSRIWLAHTPQIFHRNVIARALASLPSDENITDDAQAVEMMGHPVTLVEDSNYNIKITTPQDMIVAEAILGKKLFSSGH